MTTVTPAAGATGVAANTAVTLTFSEALTPAQSAPSTIALLGPGNAVVPASVTYNATTKTATLTPASQLALNTLYTGLAVGGSSDPRIKDIAGNAMAANFTWTFRTSTTPPPPIVCPCTIWDQDDAPANFENGDTSPVELGLKFKSDIAGFITGIRFYKNGADVGGHIANLWTSSGTLLASAPFLSETAFGWQEVSFAAPVAITANTTYVASYHLSNGRYAADQAGLLTGKDNQMLHALASETSGGNGLFVYGSSSFPTQTFNATNYWVDPVFVQSVVPDATPPNVISVTPFNGALGVDPRTSIAVVFDEAMNAATITSTNFQLLDGANPVSGTIIYNGANRTATLTPAAMLNLSAQYSIIVRGGATGVKDAAGNALVGNVVTSFITASEIPVGPSCPCTIFDPGSGGTASLDLDQNPVELGVKFTSSIDGYITAIRFFKGTPSAGSHVANLWTAAGTKLASAPFITETPVGWQEVALVPAVPITANTTYVASYHSSAGRYVVETNYFNAAVIRGPLTGLASGGIRRQRCLSVRRQRLPELELRGLQLLR